MLRAQELVAALQAMIKEHGDRDVVLDRGCEPVMDVIWDPVLAARGLDGLAPLYLVVDW